MDEENTDRFIAFEDHRCIALGTLEQVALRVKARLDAGTQGGILVFNAFTSELTELDLRGTSEEVLERIKETPGEVTPSLQRGKPAQKKPRGRGRPKLGVVAREVTLLPRHWDWLNSQPGGASVALRKLVDEARRVYSRRDKARLSQEVTYRFISAMAGNLPGFEEAARALFAGGQERFNDLISAWPVDIREHAKTLATGAF